MRSLIERFTALIAVVRESDCWIWIGYTDLEGYGRFTPAIGQSVLAHRWAYRHFKGEIPLGLTIDHLCRVTSCVNPDHLEAVTIAQNQLSPGIEQQESALQIRAFTF